jgi:glycosyltransferase involved in cell wall biosynthesis
MISLCIPTYNRTQMVIESFSKVIDNELISEIIIMDDCSEESMFNSLSELIIAVNKKKIFLFKNNENKKAFFNKIESVKKAKNDWIILLDSDNILTDDYLISIPNDLDENTFYLPSKAICNSPNLDYTEFSGLTFDKNKFKEIVLSKNDKLQCLLNTGNYFFNKKTYLNSIQMESNIQDCHALDPFYQIYLGFKNINDFKIHIVPNMQYYHRLHSETKIESSSYYTENSEKSQQFYSVLKNKILEF